MTEVSVERNLLDMLDEILFEIFRRLPSKSKLIEISRLCSRFRDIAGDTRFWKNVYIKYGRSKDMMNNNNSFAFEELYSEPWPVKVIDLSGIKILSPVYSERDQITKVTKLIIRKTKANIATMDAIFAKYQCTELFLDFHRKDNDIPQIKDDQIMEISPEAFLKQTSLEVLSVELLSGSHLGLDEGVIIENEIVTELAPILSYCRNLKALHLITRQSYLTNSNLLSLAENLPKSLEKLFLGFAKPEDSFFESLAKRTTNLKEIDLYFCSVKFPSSFPSLLNFQFLEVLHVLTKNQDYSDLYKNLMKFPALKTIYIDCGEDVNSPETVIGKVRMSLEPHGIIVRKRRGLEPLHYPKDGSVWEVSKS